MSTNILKYMHVHISMCSWSTISPKIKKKKKNEIEITTEGSDIFTLMTKWQVYQSSLSGEKWRFGTAINNVTISRPQQRITESGTAGLELRLACIVPAARPDISQLLLGRADISSSSRSRHVCDGECVWAAHLDLVTWNCIQTAGLPEAPERATWRAEV